MSRGDAEAPTGERFIPELMGGELLEAEHLARYQFAGALVRDRRVLDAGCGVGWGAQVLLDAGASSVHGLDVAADAIAGARLRVPGAEFVVGDLMDMPLQDGQFDVVVCFEALEHTTDVKATLNELRRVMAPGGILLVSSPNPDVYPAGNPFHFNELRPEHLAAEVGQRFAHTLMFRQHLLIASAILADGDIDGSAATASAGVLGSVSAKGTDPYSLVVASDRALADPRPVITMSPSAQLTDLGPAWAAVEEHRAALAEESSRLAKSQVELIQAIDAERAAWREGEARVVVERERILAERRDLYTQLDAVTARRDELQAHADALSSAVQDRDDAIRQADVVRRELEAALADALASRAAAIERHGRERESLVAQRDRLGGLLVDSEQSLAGVVAHYAARDDANAARAASAEELARIHQADAEELERVRATIAWRAVQPARRVRAMFPRRPR